MFQSGALYGSLECVNISIRDDKHFEDTETFSFFLTTTDTSVKITPARGNVEIIDNESKSRKREKRGRRMEKRGGRMER